VFTCSDVTAVATQCHLLCDVSALLVIAYISECDTYLTVWPWPTFVTWPAC